MTTTSTNDGAMGGAIGGAMDASTRAELDALRRRAYAADADIATDPVASARLIELEERLRPSVDEAAAPVAPALETTPLTHVAPAPPVPVTETAPASRRRAWHFAAVAATAAVALVLGVTAWEASTPPAGLSAGGSLAPEVADALAFANDPEVTLLYTLHLDGAFGTYVDPYPTAVPPVPIEGPVWASSLGDYYGFVLWIVGSVKVERAGQVSPSPVDERLCIAMTDGEIVHSRCVSRELWEQGALVLAVDFDDLIAEERPIEMRADQSLGLWWTDDDRIRVVLGRLD